MYSKKGAGPWMEPCGIPTVHSWSGDLNHLPQHAERWASKVWSFPPLHYPLAAFDVPAKAPLPLLSWKAGRASFLFPGGFQMRVFSHSWVAPTLLQESSMSVFLDPQMSARYQEIFRSRVAPNSLQGDLVSIVPDSQKPTQH